MFIQIPQSSAILIPPPKVLQCLHPDPTPKSSAILIPMASPWKFVWCRRQILTALSSLVSKRWSVPCATSLSSPVRPRHRAVTRTTRRACLNGWSVRPPVPRVARSWPKPPRTLTPSRCGWGGSRTAGSGGAPAWPLSDPSSMRSKRGSPMRMPSSTRRKRRSARRLPSAPGLHGERDDQRLHPDPTKSKIEKNSYKTTKSKKIEKTQW